MILTLKRMQDGDSKATTGDLWLLDEWLCFTLEPPDVVIPSGKYQVLITPSPRFGRRLPLIVDVPGHDGVRIHPGNSAKDTSGCLLVGDTLQGDYLIDSRQAFDRLFDRLDQATDSIYLDVGYA
ncbi:MAG TPA: DUF5675 family protein [Pseudolabrys sp.]